MTKYRNFIVALACCAALAGAKAASAQELQAAFAPRSVPGLELASLDVPVARTAPKAEAAPALLPAAEQAAPSEEEKGFWQQTLEFFGF